jgi:hypothetical protein
LRTLEDFMKIPRGARFLSLAALALVLAAPSLAQDRGGTAEVTIFGGGYFGGRLYAGSNTIFSQSVDVSDVGTYGLRAAYNVNRWLGLEAGFSRAEAEFKSRYRASDGGLFDHGSTSLGDLELRHWEGNLLFNMGRRRFRPYITIGAGATQFRSNVPGSRPDTDTRFTANFGGGMKLWFTPRFAFRFDARGRSSYIGARRCSTGSNDVFCRDDSYRDDNDRRRWYTSGEVTGGFTAAF